MRSHNVLDRLGQLKTAADQELCAEARKAQECSDREIMELMLSAESKCRKMYTGNYEFRPTVKCWINRGRALRVLIRCKLNSMGK